MEGFLLCAKNVEVSAKYVYVTNTLHLQCFTIYSVNDILDKDDGTVLLAHS